MYKTQKNSRIPNNSNVQAKVICATHNPLYEQRLDLIQGAIASLLVAITIMAAHIAN